MPTNEVATRGDNAVAQQPTGALSISPGQDFWTETQAAALASIGLAETPNADRAAFLHLCQTTGLDPFRREVYLIGRNDRKAPGGKKWTAQTGIDGFRHIAERTGLYGGKVRTEWCGPDGVWQDVWLDKEHPPAAARVTIARTDLAHPVFGVAMYEEFVPMEDVYEGSGQQRRKTGEKKPGGLWGKMPAHMLAKCAEALAIRTAFPRQLSSLYTAEEMHQADAESARIDAERAAQARAEARRSGASRPWAAAAVDPSREDDGEGIVVVDQHGRVISEPDTGEDGVEDATLVEEPADREALMAELHQQAEVLGTTPAALCRRWVVAHKKNVEDATDEELLDLVRSKRDLVDEARALAEKHAAESKPKKAAGKGKVVEGETAEAAAEAALAAAEQAASEPHTYVENVEAKDGSCKVCGHEYEDSLHPIDGPPDDVVDTLPVDL